MKTPGVCPSKSIEAIDIQLEAAGQVGGVTLIAHAQTGERFARGRGVGQRIGMREHQQTRRRRREQAGESREQNTRLRGAAALGRGDASAENLSLKRRRWAARFPGTQLRLQ